MVYTKVENPQLKRKVNLCIFLDIEAMLIRLDIRWCILVDMLHLENNEMYLRNLRQNYHEPLHNANR